ncbi:RING-type domain-containing protein, partial [Aphis craccivora]
MTLPHLPSDMEEYYGNQFSINLGFLNIQNLDHLRGIEQQSRMDFSRAIDGLP